MKTELKHLIILATLALILCQDIFSQKQSEIPLPAEISGKAYIIQLSSDQAPALPANYREILPFHFFGICWNGNSDDNLKFAKQMGYKYIFHRTGMENSALAKDIFFYIETPEYQVYNTLGVDRQVNPDRTYTEEQKQTYQKYFALKDTSAGFPWNMANGWYVGKTFTVQPDLQQQKVIDIFVERVVKYAKTLERPERKFLLGGLAWDVPQFPGDFWGGGKQVTLAYWNKSETSALYPDNSHEYSTYSEGRAQYYIQLLKAMEKEFPDRKFSHIFEPYNYYESWFAGMEGLSKINQEALMAKSLITQEAGVTKWSKGTEFTDDERVYKSGLVKKERTGSSTPDNHDLASNKLIAGKAAVNGAWFNWYGRFSGSGDRVPMRHIYEVPNWLQLIRVAGNWDNLNGVPLSERKWDGAAYVSTNSRIDDNIIYSRQPETRKLFVVFLNDKGVIFLKPGEKIISVMKADKYFCEAEDSSEEIIIEGNKVRLKK